MTFPRRSCRVGGIMIVNTRERRGQGQWYTFALGRTVDYTGLGRTAQRRAALIHPTAVVGTGVRRKSKLRAVNALLVIYPGRQVYPYPMSKLSLSMADIAFSYRGG